MKENVDNISKIWLPDPILCAQADELRREQEWLRKKNGYSGKRPSELGIEAYMWGSKLPEKFFEGRTPPPVPLDSLENLEWYEEQLKRCVYGFEYRGYRVTGDHYWLLNFTPFLVAKKNKRGRITNEFDVNFPYFSYMHDYIFKLIEEAHYRNEAFIWMSGRGSGKSLANSELVITPSGPKPMGSIRKHDFVVGSTGKPIKVLEVYPQGPRPIYTLTLQDGRTVNCDLEHLWTVKDSHGRMKNLTTKELMHDYRITYGNHADVFKYSIATGSGADYSEKELPIDPYVLGVLLGDGTFRKCSPAIVIANGEEEIELEIRSRLGDYYRYGKYQGNGCSWLHIGTGSVSKTNFLRESLIYTGLWKVLGEDKFIPKDYFVASRKQRLELLQGLMDTDGYCSKSGNIEFTNTSISLAHGVMSLARSLGIKTSCSKESVRVGRNNKSTYRVRLFTSLPVFKLKRKLSRIRVSNNTKQKNFQDWTSISDIRYAGYEEEATCISVEAPDSLFLTNEYTLTHNTYSILSIIAKTYHLKPKSHGIVSASNATHAEEAFNKLRLMLDSIAEVHPTLALARLQDTKGLIESGQEVVRDGVKYKEGPRSRVQRIVYGDNPGVTRGSRPDIQLLEEIGDWSSGVGDLKSCIGASVGSWRVGSIQKCRVFMIGTGGSVKSDQAKDIFTKPRSYHILQLNDFGQGHGFFLPAHYLLGGKGWEETGVCNVESAKEFLDEERERTRDDMEIHSKVTQEYPYTIEEVFRKMGTNNFNQRKIAEQWGRLNFEPDIPKPEKGFLEWIKTASGTIKGVKWSANPEGDIEIIEHPYRGPKGDSTYKGLYVAGVDSIDQGQLDSTSTKNRSSLAMLVKKRIVDGQYFKQTSNLYVAKYIGRSLDVRWDYENALKLAMYYDAEVNIEYTKIGIVGYFRDCKQYHRLMKRPMIATASAGDGTEVLFGIKKTNLIGTTATPAVIDHQDGKVKEYIEDYYQNILFTDLLEQLRDYQREDRTKFDLVIAMGLCELADEDMLGEPSKESGSETVGFKPFGWWVDDYGVRHWGELPSSTPTIFTETSGINESPARWIDASGKPRFDDDYNILNKDE